MLLYNGLLNNMKKSRRINKRKRHTKRRARYRSKTRKNKHAVMKVDYEPKIVEI